MIKNSLIYSIKQASPVDVQAGITTVLMDDWRLIPILVQTNFIKQNPRFFDPNRCYIPGWGETNVKYNDMCQRIMGTLSRYPGHIGNADLTINIRYIKYSIALVSDFGLKYQDLEGLIVIPSESFVCEIDE